MSELLDRLHELGARFAPHRFDFTLELTPLLEASSTMTRYFFLCANEHLGSTFRVDQLYETPWRDVPGLLRQFGELEPDEQVEVLVLYTVPIHELRHHVDFSVTTFGAEFHLLLAREYLAMQRLSPYLLQNQEIVPRRPLRRLDEHLEGLGRTIPEEWRPHWAAFDGSLRDFEATYDYRGVDPALSMVGPFDDEITMRAIDRDFRLVKVNGLALSLSPVDRQDWYMRASTLLEGRGVIASLLWAIEALADDPSLPGALEAYVERLYPPDAPYDYRFVLDLAAAWMGTPTFEDALRKGDWGSLRNVLHLIDVGAWFGLNGAVRKTPDGLARNNPFLRFVYALQELDRAASAGTRRTTLELLRDFDDQERGQDLGFISIDRALSNVLEALAAAENHLGEIWNREMREHFAHVFGVLGRALRRRVPEGYKSPLAAPPDGNVIRWLGGPNQFLLDAHEPGRWVHDWFRFRNRALFAPGGIWTLERLREQFGLAELVIPCECGALVSAAVPKFRDHHRVECPNCKRPHDVGAGDVRWIVDPPED